MGASTWIYYVPYQENLEQAFQALRQHVFETDDYDHWWSLHVHTVAQFSARFPSIPLDTTL